MESRYLEFCVYFVVIIMLYAYIYSHRIFEHTESAEDTIRLLCGKLPNSRTGPPATLLSNGFPISRHYARLLADVAFERGFDGYLLNFEFQFVGRSEQARAIEAWISILNSELKSKVGDYAQTIWLVRKIYCRHRNADINETS